MSRLALLRKPSAFLPVAMSAAALATVLIYVAKYGVARQPDEGTAAHLWQMLMVLQMPVIAYFVIRYLPEDPKHVTPVLLLQLLAAFAAAAPVFLLGF